MEFKQSVKIGGDGLKGNDKLIDTADTSSDTKPLIEDEGIDEQPPVDGEVVSDDLSDEDESEEDELGEQPGAETPEGQFDGYKTFEEYKTAKEAEIETIKNPQNTAVPPDLDEGEKQKFVFTDFYNKHKDILPESVLDNYLKFWQSGASGTPIVEYLRMDDHLYKLTNEMDKFRDDVPFQEKLERAFNNAFSDEVIKKKQDIAQKQGEVRAEIRTQKVNRAASTSIKNESGGNKKYSSDQEKMAKKMGIQLD